MRGCRSTSPISATFCSELPQDDEFAYELPLALIQKLQQNNVDPLTHLKCSPDRVLCALLAISCHHHHLLLPTNHTLPVLVRPNQQETTKSINLCVWLQMFTTVVVVVLLLFELNSIANKSRQFVIS